VATFNLLIVLSNKFLLLMFVFPFQFACRLRWTFTNWCPTRRIDSGSGHRINSALETTLKLKQLLNRHEIIKVNKNKNIYIVIHFIDCLYFFVSAVPVHGSSHLLTSSDESAYYSPWVLTIGVLIGSLGFTLLVLAFFMLQNQRAWASK